MAGGRPMAVLEVSDAERRELESLARRRKTAQALALRARIVLHCAEGLTNTEVTTRLAVAKLDNYATHKTPAVRRWFQRHPEYRVHVTPTSASWLNQIERFFAEITTRRLRRSALHSVAALEQAIRAYLDEHNKTPKPFAWTATADTILERVANVCKRTSSSGH